MRKRLMRAVAELQLCEISAISSGPGWPDSAISSSPFEIAPTGLTRATAEAAADSAVAQGFATVPKP